MTSRHVVILGAGPAGLATGHELAVNQGKVTFTVTVLEKNSYVGGLCRTVEHQGYRFDLGGHRWFTKNDDLNEWFRQLMHGELVDVERISRIYYDGKFFFYPIGFADIIKKTGVFTIAHAGVAFLAAAVKYSLLNKPINNMKEAYTAQFGSKLYEMFFRRYSEKIWGRPCEQLSADWIAQRSKGLSMWSTVQEALLGNRKKLASLIESFMYPRDGYARIPERMAEDIIKAGNDVMLGTAVTGIIYHGPDDFEVCYQRDGQEKSLRAEAVVSTIPLNFLVQSLQPGCPDAVLQAAKGLEFRDLVTVTLMLRRERVSKDTWLYVQDEDVIFGRLHEPKNWSAALVPDAEHTSLVLECFCSQGDHIWQLSDTEIAQRCVEDLVNKLGFIKHDDVEDSVVIRTRFAYPIYDPSYSKNSATIKNYLAELSGLHIVGRGGTFRYNNADHSIEMGLLLGRSILGAGVDHMAVNTESEYHEQKTATGLQRDQYVLRPRLNEK